MRPVVLLVYIGGVVVGAAQSESQCTPSVPTKCTDDLQFLRCSVEAALVALQRSGDNAEQCTAMVDKGFCISQATEMAAYCCRAFSHHCINGTDSDSILEPPGHSFVVNSTTLYDNIPSNETTGNASTKAAANEEVCALIRDTANVGLKAMHAVKENFPWILEDFGSSFGESAAAEAVTTTELEPSTSRPRRNRSLQQNADPTTETNLRNSNRNTEQDGVMAWLALLTAGDGGLIQALLPEHNWTATDYGEIETRIIEGGMKIVDILEDCGSCLLPLIQRTVGDICLAEGDSTSTRESNQTALIQLTPSELSKRLVTFARTFLTQLRTQQEAAGEPSQSFGSFLGKLTDTIGIVLESDDLGGMISNLLPVVSHVASRYDDPEERQLLLSETTELYSNVFGCTETLVEDQSAMLGSPLSPAVDSSEADPSAASGPSDDEPAKDPVPSVFQRRLAIDVESPKEVNFIPDLSMEAHKAEFMTQQSEGEILEGQPCLDRPSDFVASMLKVYNDLSCNDLISSVGCFPERFIVDLPTFVRACADSWATRCLSSQSANEEIASILSKQLCTSPSSPALRTDSKRADSACSVPLSAALNVALFLVSMFLFV